MAECSRGGVIAHSALAFELVKSNLTKPAKLFALLQSRQPISDRRICNHSGSRRHCRRDVRIFVWQARPAQFRRHRRPARPGGRLRQLGAVRVGGEGACRRAPCNEGALAAVGSTLIELACAAIPQGPTAAWSPLTVTADLPATSIAAPTFALIDPSLHPNPAAAG